MLIHAVELTKIKPLPILPWEEMKVAKPVTSSLMKHYRHQGFQLAKTCMENNGIGLSGNQVGINQEMFVIRLNDQTYKIFFNSKWLPDIDSTLVEDTEGCLSQPNALYKVNRPNKINASFWELDKDEKPLFVTKKLDGLYARCFMHEHDHHSLKTIEEIGYLIIDQIPSL